MNDFFKKLFFGAKQSSKKLDVLLIFEFFGNIYGLIRPVLINLIAGRSESVEILPKC